MTRDRAQGRPALLSYGFRPFFLLAALTAAAAVPAWLAALAAGYEIGGVFSPRDWHAHEMIFGYLGAVVAGFILTAVPNWTGRLPVKGWRLGALAGLWIAGRVAVSTLDAAAVVFLIDGAFLVALAGVVWREIVAGRHFRGAPVALMITLLALANILFHAQQAWPALTGYGERLALAAAALLMALIGGRITPSFTRNWMVKAGVGSLPRPFGSFDKAALSMTALAVALWVAAPDYVGTGAGLLLAGLCLLLRLVRWRGVHTAREPIVFILHVGYLWLVAAMLLLGLAILAPSAVEASSALHALTVGAVGTLTLAVMTRATLGHTGREIHSAPSTVLIYALITVAAVVRVAAPYIGGDYMDWLLVAGIAWTGAFALFAAVFGPMLIGPRVATDSVRC